MILSILIPSTHDRYAVLQQLLVKLYNQIWLADLKGIVEIKTNVDNYELSIGMKRNIMLLNCTGEWVVFIDSDDEVVDTYISDIIGALKERPDVVGFLGYITTNNGLKEGFKISKDLPYQTITDEHGNKFYERYNNHLSPIKKEIALQIMFSDSRFGEDYEFAKKLKESGLVKTEIFIPKELYHYKYVSNK